MLTVGVDVSTKRLALADSHGYTDSLMLMTSPDRAANLADAHHRSGIFARQFLDGRKVHAVFIETPGGKFLHPYLMQTVGAVTAGIWWGLRGVDRHPVTCFAVPVATWKKRSVGKGNAGKPEILAWAQERGYEGQCSGCLARGKACRKPSEAHDEADALGIALAGLDLLREGAQTW